MAALHSCKEAFMAPAPGQQGSEGATQRRLADPPLATEEGQATNTPRNPVVVVVVVGV
jgi:hypothetical protein